MDGEKESTVLKWNERMTEAFERLKEEIARDVELAYPDYSEWARPLEVYRCKWLLYGKFFNVRSSFTVDGVERKRMISYVLKAFIATERKYSPIERKLAALTFCLKTLQPFLYELSL